MCNAEVFLLAVVENAPALASLEGGVALSMDDQFTAYKAILAEGVERLKGHGILADGTTSRWSPHRRIAGVAEEIGANLVVVGHRPTGPLARWSGRSVSNYLTDHLRCSVLIAQTEIGNDQFRPIGTATPAAPAWSAGERAPR